MEIKTWTVLLVVNIVTSSSSSSSSTSLHLYSMLSLPCRVSPSLRVVVAGDRPPPPTICLHHAALTTSRLFHPVIWKRIFASVGMRTRMSPRRESSPSGSPDEQAHILLNQDFVHYSEPCMETCYTQETIIFYFDIHFVSVMSFGALNIIFLSFIQEVQRRK